MFQINGEYWQILLVSPYDPSLLMPNGNYALGACDDFMKTIYINAALHEDDIDAVLRHELVHAAMYSYNIPLEREKEEKLAEIIANFGEEIIMIFNNIKKGRL